MYGDDIMIMIHTSILLIISVHVRVLTQKITVEMPKIILKPDQRVQQNSSPIISGGRGQGGGA